MRIYLKDEISKGIGNMGNAVRAKRRYENLLSWQRALDLVDVIYDTSEHWPKTELYRLVDQTRRAAVSVPANIAEGQGRTGPNEYLHHLSIAFGSLMETETLLIIAKQRGFVSDVQYDQAMDLATDVGRLILATMTSLKKFKSST